MGAFTSGLSSKEIHLDNKRLTHTYSGESLKVKRKSMMGNEDLFDSVRLSVLWSKGKTVYFAYFYI